MTKEKIINIRVSEEEYRLIESRAKDMKMTVSAYIRMVALKAKIKIEV